MPRRSSLLFALGVFVLWLAVPATILWLFDHENAGQIGDTFNVVSSLFSALAFLGVAYSLYLQRAEMTETRIAQQEELRIALESSRLQTISSLLQHYQEALKEKSNRIQVVPRSPEGLDALAEKFTTGTWDAEPRDVTEISRLVACLKHLHADLEEAYDERIAQAVSDS